MTDHARLVARLRGCAMQPCFCNAEIRQAADAIESLSSALAAAHARADESAARWKASNEGLQQELAKERGEVARLRALNEGLAARIASQSDQLSMNAERAAGVGLAKVACYLRVLACGHIEGEDVDDERDAVWESLSKEERDAANDLTERIFGEWS